MVMVTMVTSYLKNHYYSFSYDHVLSKILVSQNKPRIPHKRPNPMMHHEVH